MVIPTAIAASKLQFLLSKNGRIMNKDNAGITNQSIPSAKSATLAVSLVSLYNQNNESILTSGKDTINAPKIDDFFAISLAVTTIAPLSAPLPSHSNHAIYCDLHILC